AQRATLRDCLREGGLLAPGNVRDGDDDVVRSELDSECDGSVEHEVRDVAEQHLVLAGERLAFRRVHEDDRAPALRGDGGNLARDRERAAAAPLQAAHLENRLERPRALRLERSVTPQMLRERYRPFLPEAGEQPWH